jgi:intergrase/recombinase
MNDKSPLLQILFYGGIRITEAEYLMKNRDTIKSEDCGNFIRYSVKWFRGPKRCDYVYLPKFVNIPKITNSLDLHHLWRNNNGNNPKLLRKFFYRTAKHTALENRFDPLIADFYQSRVSKFTIGEKHYGELKSEANRLYPKVMEQLSKFLSEPVAVCTQ